MHTAFEKEIIFLFEYNFAYVSYVFSFQVLSSCGLRYLVCKQFHSHIITLHPNPEMATAYATPAPTPNYADTARVLQRVRSALSKRAATASASSPPGAGGGEGDGERASRAREACVYLDTLVAVIESPAFVQLQNIQRGSAEVQRLAAAGVPVAADEFEFAADGTTPSLLALASLTDCISHLTRCFCLLLSMLIEFYTLHLHLHLV